MLLCINQPIAAQFTLLPCFILRSSCSEKKVVEKKFISVLYKDMCFISHSQPDTIS